MRGPPSARLLERHVAARRGAALAVLLAALVGCAEGGAGDDPRNDAAETTMDAAPETPPRDTGPAPDTTAADTGTESSCGAGEALCGGKCIGVVSDPTNCGACASTCTSPAHAAPTCVAGVCGHACIVGFLSCDGRDDNGCETDYTTSTANCGACGSACATRPNADAACVSSKCTDTCRAGFVDRGGVCSNFGGAYETHSSTCGTCSDGNPLASDTCACPGGTVAGASYAARNDACGSLRPSNIRFCDSAGGGATVWGGAYQQDDAVTCGSGCRVSNPKSGSCGCPAGYSASPLRVVVDTTCGFIGSTIGVCVHGSAPLDGFGGVYQVDDPVTGGLGCRIKNARTGSCSCPGGYSSQSLRVLVDYAGGQIGSHVYVCVK